MDLDTEEPLDKDYGIEDVAPSSLKQAQQDVDDFFELAAELIEKSGMDDRRVGHDFWLTRNGHGAGFWDRGLGKVGDDLTRDAETYGGIDPYVGDDGLVYIE